MKRKYMVGYLDKENKAHIFGEQNLFKTMIRLGNSKVTKQTALKMKKSLKSKGYDARLINMDRI